MRQSAAPVLRVGVLGPLEVSVDGRPVAVTSGRLRTLLAVLAAAAGAPVSIDRLADAVWGDQLPADARRGVQIYVTRLRNALGADAIRTFPDGYQLASDDVDALRFTRLLDGAAAAPDPDTERSRLEAAIALWRGAPFEGVRSAWLTEVEAPRLVERYLAALERHVDLELDGGRHVEVLARLGEITARHPLRERFWGQTMLALYRAGRQADALDAYQRLRRLLDDELGVEPTRSLRDLHRRILAADAGLDVPTHRPAAPLPVPRQLPAGIADFTGRDDLIARLDALLPPPGGATVVAAITGGAGVGKTALAVHWSHRVEDRYPDGQLYVDLRGLDQPMRPEEAVSGFVEALGVAPQRIPAELHAQVGLYRSLLAGKRVLVVLDNARDTAQVGPLLPGGPGCLVVVTSRDEQAGLVAAHGAHPVTVDVLTPEEARHLLARRLGPRRLAGDPAAVEEIIASCVRLPLALSIVAARAAIHPAFPLATLAAELRDSRARLDALSGPDATTDVRAVFSWSYRALTPGAARLFRLLGRHPGPDVGVPAAASLAAVPPAEVRPLLAELSRAHLVTERSPGRFGFHDLLRAYAAELALAHDDVAAATRRVLDHYLATAVDGAHLLNPHRDHPVVVGSVETGVTPEVFVDHREALAWFAAERAVVLASIQLAAADGFDRHASELPWASALFLSRTGHWHEWLATQRVALEATERYGSPLDLGRAHRGLSRAYARLGRFDEARAHLRHALRIYEGLGDAVGEAHTHNGLGMVAETQGRYSEALDHAQRAVALFRRGDDVAGEALALNGVGWCHARLGDYAQTLIHCGRALELARKVGDRFGESTTCDSLGYAHHRLGDHDQAVSCYRQALAVRRDRGERQPAAHTLIRLGDVYLDAGDTEAARAAWTEAAETLDDLGDPAAADAHSRLAT